jgi:hypothetical protein
MPHQRDSRQRSGTSDLMKRVQAVPTTMAEHGPDLRDIFVYAADA